MDAVIISLKEKWEELKVENPKLRIRDAAKKLQVSEAELLNTQVGKTVTRLEGDWKAFLQELAPLGKIMALTRNDYAVHERKGIYDNVTFQGPVGTALNPDIDLRLFMMHWQFGYSVNENDRLSFQFFDKSGDAIHKIYMVKDSNKEVFEQLTEKYKAEQQHLVLETKPYPPIAPEKPDDEVDVKNFHEDWRNMTDTHQFFEFLGKYEISRMQAMRLAPEDFVEKQDVGIVRTMLQAASKQEVPIMAFVGNRGSIQIHSGKINKVVDAAGWLNILDPDFNLHLKDEEFSDCFIVKKPSEGDYVTSIEVYDQTGEMIVQFFGERKPGKPELEGWRSILKEVAKPIDA